MTGVVLLDRRRRRRLETIEQVLDVAVEVMAEQGVAGLRLGEVARRTGIRPPSLYGHFDGEHALYDALFGRGWRLLDEDLRRVSAARDGADPVADLHSGAAAFVRRAVEHPAYSTLMLRRPVPGFVPSEAAYPGRRHRRGGSGGGRATARPRHPPGHRRHRPRLRVLHRADRRRRLPGPRCSRI